MRSRRFEMEEAKEREELTKQLQDLRISDKAINMLVRTEGGYEAEEEDNDGQEDDEEALPESYDPLPFRDQEEGDDETTVPLLHNLHFIGFDTEEPDPMPTQLHSLWLTDPDTLRGGPSANPPRTPVRPARQPGPEGEREPPVFRLVLGRTAIR